MNKKQKAAAAAMAAVAAAGVITGTVFESPAELAEDLLPAAAEQQLEEETTVAEERRQKGPAAKIRTWIMGLPAAVRLLVGVPLWCVGWMVLTGLSTLWMGVTAPLVSRVLGWLCLAVLLLVVFAVSVKAAFPALRLKEIFRLRNIVLMLSLSMLLMLADMALPSVWEGYDAVSQAVWRIGAFCLLAASCFLELKHQGKRASVRSASVRTEVEETARALADTVCPPRF